jgi:sorbitol-specific phosphotransferase system component IIA
VGLLKIEVLMVGSGVKKALAESGHCSIALLLWVRACWQSVLCGMVVSCGI